jgi:hypothetical protein
MPLQDYINLYFNGSSSSFARFLKVKPQQVYQWKKKDFIVVNHVLYSPRRDFSILL